MSEKESSFPSSVVKLFLQSSYYHLVVLQYLLLTAAESWTARQL